MEKRILARKKEIVAFAFLSMTMVSSVMAMVMPEQPDAGKTLQNSKQPEMNIPADSSVSIRVEEKRNKPGEASTGTKIIVNKLTIVGSTVFSQAELTSGTQDICGKERSLADLYQLTEHITDYYHQKGFLVARAYLPAQDIIDGAISIVVVEGKYEKIVINNHANVLNSMVQAALASIQSGAVVKDKPLERSMLLLNDIPGVTAKATLTPGIAPGTTDLIITVDKTSAISGNLEINNYGNRYTGSSQAGATVHVNNLSKQGDDLSLYGLSAGSGLNDWRLSYTIPANQGLYIGVSQAKMNYELGDIFAASNSHGSAITTNLYARYAFLRSRNANLYSQVSYDDKQLHDYIGAQPSNDKRSHSWTTTLFGDNRDQWFGSGITSYALSYGKGNLAITDAQHSGQDRLTAKTAGNYEKWNLNLARLQYVSHSLSLYTSVRGQFAAGNLDSSEKISLGGPNGVRAYPAGEASGDQGYVMNIELRRNLPSPTWLHGDLQLVGFYDHGDIYLNKNTWPTYTGDNHRALSGAGVGLVCSRSNDYSVRINYAWKVGMGQALSDRDKNGRLWLQGIKYY